MTLQELAELVEGAEGPSRELDSLILTAAFGYIVEAHQSGDDYFYNRIDRMGRLRVPSYTASLDAAMTLVPEGWALESLSYWPSSPEGADEQTGPKASASLVGASLKRFGRRMVWGHTASDGRADGDSATPALALCAASLRAIARAQAPAPGEGGEG